MSRSAGLEVEENWLKLELELKKKKRCRRNRHEGKVASCSQKSSSFLQMARRFSFEQNSQITDPADSGDEPSRSSSIREEALPHLI